MACGHDVCPAAVFIPWDVEALPAHLSEAVTPTTPWVLKRDAMSNGEGVFFVHSVDEAMDIIGSQRQSLSLTDLRKSCTDPTFLPVTRASHRAGSYMTFLSHGGDVSHFVLQRCILRPLLLAGHKFHLRVYALAATTPGNTHAALAVWHGVEVRLAPKIYTGDVNDRGAALTNFAPSRGDAAQGGLLIKRMVSEFQEQLGEPVAIMQRIMALVRSVTDLTAVPAPKPGAPTADAGDDPTWQGIALFALDVLMDSDSDALWLLEVNRGPAGGVESLDDRLQSAPYKAHLIELCSAILDVALSLAAADDATRAIAWPTGFHPVEHSSTHDSGALSRAAAAEMCTLMQIVPPRMQAALALELRRSAPHRHSCSEAVIRDLALLAGESGTSTHALATYVTQWRSSQGGRSIVQIAAQHGLHALLPWLINLAPSLTRQPDAGGATPLGLAARGGHSAAGIVLLAAGADHSSDDVPLHAAAGTDAVPLVRALIASGASPDAALETGMALHWAAAEGAARAAACLLAHGADVDALDTDDLTPLLLAVTAGHAAVVQVLLSGGADPRKSRLPVGATILHVAADVGDENILKLLLARPSVQAMLHARDSDGCTPYDVAVAGEGCARVLSMLNIGTPGRQYASSI